MNKHKLHINIMYFYLSLENQSVYKNCIDNKQV